MCTEECYTDRVYVVKKFKNLPLAMKSLTRTQITSGLPRAHIKRVHNVCIGDNFVVELTL